MSTCNLINAVIKFDSYVSVEGMRNKKKKENLNLQLIESTI